MNPSLDPVGEIDAAFASFERDHPVRVWYKADIPPLLADIAFDGP